MVKLTTLFQNYGYRNKHTQQTNALSWYQNRYRTEYRVLRGVRALKDTINYNK